MWFVQVATNGDSESQENVFMICSYEVLNSQSYNDPLSRILADPLTFQSSDISR